MIEKYTYGYIICIVIGILLIITTTSNNTIAAQDQNNTNITTTTSAIQNQTKVATAIAGQNQFSPVQFKEIPLVVINSVYREDKFGADFSLDLGNGTVIEQDFSASSVPNMQLDKDDTTLSLQLLCDSNDICDTSLAPESVSVYLVDDDIQDIQIAENAIPTLPLGSNDNCGSDSIQDCANFALSIRPNIILGNYKIVVDMSFDEARWIFINPVEILDSANPRTANVVVVAHVINDNGGTKQLSDFGSFQVYEGSTPVGPFTNVSQFIGSESGTTTTINAPGYFYVAPPSPGFGYSINGSPCDQPQSIQPGNTVTCNYVFDDL